MKVGIVVPFSWSFWGGVNEHAELQAEALAQARLETRTIIGNDPPGTFTRALHPRHGRHDDPPADVIPVGRSVIVPANGSLPNIVLTPEVPLETDARILERERFDVLHLHEPMTPAICVAALAVADVPDGRDLARGRRARLDPRRACRSGGSCMDRIDYRIAVSEQARASATRWLPGEYEVIPNGALIPPAADPADRENTIVFIGRHDPRKGMPVLLARVARDPPPDGRAAARRRRRSARRAPAALARAAFPTTGIDMLGFLTQEELTARAARARRRSSRRRSAWRASAWC